jgi:dihydrofolate synthase/folylpolyglutamate synthase
MDNLNHLADLLRWTQARIGSKAAMKERFGSLLSLFEQDISFPIIKVAGTNGKGSVSAMLTACLTEAGQQVGLFTSPHLVSPTERFRIGHKEISEKELNILAKKLGGQLKEWVREKGAAYTPSFFEVLILIGLRFFAEKKVDIAVFEAGVGGDNDAVSLLPDLCALLTNVGLDHRAQLGNTLAAIATDKAGIARAGTLIINRQIPAGLKSIIRQTATANGVTVLESKKWILPGSDEKKIRLRIEGRRIELLPSLKGAFQKENMDLVMSAYQFLMDHGRLSTWEGVKGFEKTYWPGRFERMGEHPRWLIDAAHNESGLRALLESLNEHSKKSERVLIYGNSEEKDYPTLLKLVPDLASQVYLVDDFYKAVVREELLRYLDPEVRILAPGTLPLALAHAQKNSPDRLIVITGSIFMIGQARKWIIQHGLD